MKRRETKRKLIQIVTMERIVVVRINVNGKPSNESMNAAMRRIMKRVIWIESLKTSFLSKIVFISFCIFSEVKKPRIIPMLIISIRRTMIGVRRKIYLMLTLNTSLRRMKDRMVSIPIDSNEMEESSANSFFFPLRNHVAKTKNRNTKRNIPASDNS